MFYNKIKNKIQIKILFSFFTRFSKIKYAFLSANKIIGNNIYISPILAMGNGKIYADGVNFGVYQSPGYFNTYHFLDARSLGSTIKIQEGTCINNNSFICAEKTSIEIGKNCLIGTNFFCVDSDFHDLNPMLRLSDNHVCQPVFIENNVFIGSNVSILKGVRVGENSVVGANSVVTKNVPKNVIVAGNPARIIRGL